MAAPYILARTFGEAHQFAQEKLGLARGYYRVVTSPGSIKGPRGADLHLVPGWEGRFDRFSMKGALRWTRLNIVDHTAEPVEAPDTRYADDERTHEIALRYNRLLDDPFDGYVDAEAVKDDLEPAGEQMILDGTETPAAEPATEEEPPAEEPKRRRRRCKECGVLVEPDEVAQHEAEHLPEGV